MYFYPILTFYIAAQKVVSVEHLRNSYTNNQQWLQAALVQSKLFDYHVQATFHLKYFQRKLFTLPK